MRGRVPAGVGKRRRAGLTAHADQRNRRRDARSHESNAIGTLSLRSGLLEDPLRGQLREALGAYSDARIALGGSRSRPENLRAARRESEALHVVIWSIVESANRPTTANATLAALISSANEVIDLHELRLASIQNHLPPALFLLLLTLAALSVAFLAWSFGAASHRGRVPMVLLALLLGAVLLLIMDVNRPQRGMIQVGVAPLERVAESISAPTDGARVLSGDQRLAARDESHAHPALDPAARGRWPGEPSGG
jgi:hypothetical protein